MKNTITAGLVIIAVVAGLGIDLYYTVYNKSHRDILNERAEFELTAEQLQAEYEQDETAAHEKYGNKVVAVKGEIAEISGDTSVTLILSGAACSLHEMENRRPEAGEIIKIKGRVTGYDDLFGDVRIDNCIIL